MTFIARRLAAASITVVTLGLGAAPALASAPMPKTRLAQAITRLEPSLRQTTDPSSAGAVRQFSENVERCERAADEVARIHADRQQRTAQLDWVTGVRLQAAADDQVISAVQADGGARLDNEGQAGLTEYNLSNTYIAYADQLLAGDAGPLPTALR